MMEALEMLITKIKYFIVEYNIYNLMNKEHW